MASYPEERNEWAIYSQWADDFNQQPNTLTTIGAVRIGGSTWRAWTAAVESYKEYVAKRIDDLLRRNIALVEMNRQLAGPKSSSGD